MKENRMAVKVYLPGKNAPRSYEKGERFYVADGGHLVVAAPWDRESSEAQVVAIFAPGQWSHAAVSGATAEQD
jgi:hypothetical protein